MEFVWLVLAFVAVDLAAVAFAADTRPGLEYSSRWWNRRSVSG
jgi:hypothetical protein